MAIPTDPEGVSLSYNGYTFGTYVKTRVTEEPQWSGDGRVVKFSKLTIEVSGWLTQLDADFFAAVENAEDDPDNEGDPIILGATLDDFMVFLRRKLQVAGKPLIYKNKGFGWDLDINGTSAESLIDCAMGPRPGRFTWWPLGGAPDGCHGAGFSWSISTCIPECGSFPQNPGESVFVEISYTTGYDTDEAGLVTITTRGNAQIPMSLGSAGLTVRNIDDSIGQIIKPPPIGFIRRVSRQISADRASCTFTITDRQLEVPPPEDVVSIDMKERIRQKGRYMPLWVCSITGNVRMAPTATKGLAWQRFFNIVAYRMALARSKTVGFANSQGKPASVLPGTIEMEEDLFKNESRFTVNFDIVGAEFASIVRLSGLWRPIVVATGVQLDQPTTSGSFTYAPWTSASWSASMQANKSQLAKGLLGASFSSGGDIILNICDAALVDSPVSNPISGPVRNDIAAGVTQKDSDWDDTVDDVVASMQRGEDDEDDSEDADLSVLGVEDGDDSETPLIVPVGVEDSRFDPETTWMVWQCDLERLTDHNQIRHKPLSGDVTYDDPPADPLGAAADLASVVSNPTAGWTASVPDIIQQVASPSMTLRLRGMGVRAAYRVNAPKLISFGGVTPVLLREWERESTKGQQDTTIFKLEWVLDYLIPAAPKTIPVLADPLLGNDGEDTGDSGPGDNLKLAH